MATLSYLKLVLTKKRGSKFSVPLCRYLIWRHREKPQYRDNYNPVYKCSK